MKKGLMIRKNGCTVSEPFLSVSSRSIRTPFLGAKKSQDDKSEVSHHHTPGGSVQYADSCVLNNLCNCPNDMRCKSCL